VTFTEVGYTGGTTPNATYQQVCGGHTGHCEAVLVKYDTSQVSLDQILKKFWQINQRISTLWQRRTVPLGDILFYRTTKPLCSQGSPRKSSHRAIFTEITEASPFWRAEEYHQITTKKIMVVWELRQALIIKS
jgi:peptide-methionine (S)-S-oxide reductase